MIKLLTTKLRLGALIGVCSLSLGGCATAFLEPAKEARELVAAEIRSMDVVEKQLIEDAFWMTCDKPDFDILLERYGQDREKFFNWLKFCEHNEMLQWFEMKVPESAIK